MSAPALVLLGYGSRDARATAVLRAHATRLQQRRPDLTVSTAYLGHSAPRLDRAVARLADQGHEEVVVVPVLLTGGKHAAVDLPAAVASARAAAPTVRVVVAERLGLHAAWLEVLDERVRAALRATRTTELDGLVLACAGSTDPLVNAAVVRIGRTWSQAHNLPVVTAHAAVAPPSPGEAVRRLRAQGRHRVAVGSFFLAPGVMSDRSDELALEAGAVAVSAPLGLHDTLTEALLQRYQVAALRSLALV